MTVRLPDTSIWGSNAGMNPRDPFDLRNPDYLDRPDIVMSYQSSLEDRVLALALRAAAAATPTAAVPLPKPRPSVPGESSAYYLNRTAEASAARPVEHQWMLADPRIGQNQAAPDLNGDPDSPASFDERWILENPGMAPGQPDPNLVRRPVGRDERVSTGTEPSWTPLPTTADGYSPETIARLRSVVPLAAQMWSENAAALKAKGILIEISSGHRSKEENERAKGAKNSSHLRGLATDIPFKKLSTEQRQAVVSQFLADPRVNGFGYYPGRDAIHVDVRSGPRKAWGEDYTENTVGAGWPKWLDDVVRFWWKGVPLPKPRAQ
jgi:hypothetical protein